MVSTVAVSPMKQAPTSHLTAAYGLFVGLAFVIYKEVAGGEFSALLTMAVMFQCLSLVLLAMQVLFNRSAAGISARALQLDASSLCFRLSSTLWLNGYLPVDMTGDWIYQAFDVCSLCIVVWLIVQVLTKHKDTYQKEHDTLSATPMLLVSFALGALFHADMNSRPLFDSLWMAGLFVGVVAVLPQLWMITRAGGKADALTSHYIAAMAASRVMSGIFMWHARSDVTCEFWIEGFNHAIFAILAAHAIHLLLLVDFVYYYLKAIARGGLANMQLDLESLV